MTNVREVLEEGYRLIERGWFQGPPANTQTGEGYRECALTAVQDSLSASSILHDALPADHEHGGWPERCLVTWNNTPGRTQQDVLDLYKEAIANAPLEESHD